MVIEKRNQQFYQQVVSHSIDRKKEHVAAAGMSSTAQQPCPVSYKVACARSKMQPK
jgi:hypothetical protein